MSYGEGDTRYANIYVAPIDGSASTRISTAPGSHEGPAWSPGEDILYSFKPPDGSWHVAALKPDGSASRQVTPRSIVAVSPSWSPDRRMIAFVALGTAEQYGEKGIYLCDPDGSGLRPLPSTEPGDRAPAWTPDGQAIAFVRGTSVYLADLEAPGVRHVVDGVASPFVSVGKSGE